MSDNMTKKIIAFGLWIAGFSLPFHYGILSTEENDYAGHGNMYGLASFVLAIALLFAGYWFYDSATPKKAPVEEKAGH
jgi:hypothetical protein